MCRFAFSADLTPSPLAVVTVNSRCGAPQVSNEPSEKEDRGSHGTGDSISTLLFNLSRESLSSLFEDDEDSSCEDDSPASQEDRQHRERRLGLIPPPKLGSPHSPAQPSCSRG